MRIVIGFRAAIALAAALVVTFTRPDKAALGLAIFAGFGLAHGLGSLVIGFLQPKTKPITNVLPQATITVGTAALALVALGGAASARLAALQVLVISFLGLNAAFETYLASRSGFKTVEGREHLIAAGLGALIACIFVALNPEPLNASGFLGAYFALSAVHQAIWAASPTKAD